MKRRGAISGLLIGLLISGCVSNRLKGPLHPAESAPFISPAYPARVAPFEVGFRLVLIGDAGLYMKHDATLAALGRWAGQAPESAVIFLGDNLYPRGLVDDDRERGEEILAQELAATPVRKIVIPGNHDWGFSERSQNVEAIENQQAFVDDWPGDRTDFIPRDGCLGPETRVLSEPRDGRKAIVVVALDPTPWIHPRLLAACPRPQTEESSLARLDETLAAHVDDFVVMISHYPMLTAGPHGGLTYGPAADVVVGGIRWMVGGLMDTDELDYEDWIERTQAVMRRHPPLVYAAGHDHSLQILDARGVAGAYVVSGAGSLARISTVTHVPETLFAHAAPGFVALDFGKRGPEEVAVLRVVETAEAEPVFEYELPRAGSVEHPQP